MPSAHTTGTTAGTSASLAEKSVLTVDEVAEITGKHVATVRGWINDGHISARKVGRAFEVDRKSLEEWLGRAVLPTRAPAQFGGVYDPNWGVFTRDPFGTA